MLHPIGRNDLTAIIQTFLQQALTKFGHTLRLKIEPPAATRFPLGTRLPIETIDAERGEKTGTEIVEQWHTGNLPDNGREQVSIHRIVCKTFSRLGRKRASKIITDPIERVLADAIRRHKAGRHC